MKDENSFKYPLVTISFDSKNVYISGPSKQVDIAKSSYEQKYVSVFRLDKKRYLFKSSLQENSTICNKS